MRFEASRTLSFVISSESGALPKAKLTLCSCNSSSVKALLREASNRRINSGSGAVTFWNCFRSDMGLPSVRESRDSVLETFVSSSNLAVKPLILTYKRINARSDDIALVAAINALAEMVESPTIRRLRGRRSRASGVSAGSRVVERPPPVPAPERAPVNARPSAEGTAPRRRRRSPA